MTEPNGLSGSDLTAVVVVSFEPASSIAGCVRSVFDAAGDVRVELILVDNASPAHTAETVGTMQPGVRVIRNESNRGFAAAANQGMRSASSPFVLLINPDARVVGGTLERFLKVARDRPRAAAVGALTRNPDGSIYPSARKVPTLLTGLVHTVAGPFWPQNPLSRGYRMSDWDRQSERQVDWVSGSSVLMRREALEQAAYFDEGFFMYVEDMDLCTRFRADGWEVWFSPELEIEHVGGTATAGKRRMTLEHSRSMYRYFVKHRSSGWRVVLRPLAWLALMWRAKVVSVLRHER